jgi:ABC-type transport system substrate-binding protein
MHSKYVPDQNQRVFPINMSQMDGDFMDPDNAAVGVFMEGTHSHGLNASITGYTDLVRLGRFEANPETRPQIYYLLQGLAFEDAIAIFTVQPTYAVAMRDSLHGWYPHPPQWPMVPYFYPLWKE